LPSRAWMAAGDLGASGRTRICILLFRRYERTVQRVPIRALRFPRFPGGL
jgi:hypothetical protein